MGSVIRKFASAASAGADTHIHTAQGTEIHWAAPGRAVHDVVAATPSIHAVWGGRQPVSVDRRALRLDDQTFLVLNAGHVLTARARRDPTTSMLSVYFAPAMLLEALDELSVPQRQLLRSWTQDGSVQLFEHLRARDKAIDAVLRYIAHHVRDGVEDAMWCEEQVRFLLSRLLANECALAGAAGAGARTWRRHDVLLRLARVTDLIHCAYERPLTIDELGEAAHWSVFHLMREFKAVHGVTPHEYLQRRRTQAAAHLLRTTQLSVVEIAERAGFRDRSTMMRRLRRVHGSGARALRASTRIASPQPTPHRSATGASSPA